MQITESFLLHTKCLSGILVSGEQGQADKEFGDISRHDTASGHAFIPAPGTIRSLQFLQLRQGGDASVRQVVQVEQNSDTCLLFRFRSGFQQPRAFFEKDVLHILIFLQLAEEGLFPSVLHAPAVEDGFDARLAVGDVSGEGIGIVSGGPGSGIVSMGLAQHRQCLNGIPGGIAGELYGQTAVGGRAAIAVEEAVQTESAGLFTAYRHGKGFGDILLVAQYGQQVLLAVAECAAIGNHADT